MKVPLLLLLILGIVSIILAMILPLSVYSLVSMQP